MNELFIYKINNEVDVPIYEQLVDMIKADIVSSKLMYGTKLPTVRELSDFCSVARGTVMRAYDELENLGYIEKVQGRGTSVCYKPGQPSGRKDTAMKAIDEMLDKLFELGFSDSEIDIFLDLKLRERGDTPGGLKVAVIECNSEVLMRISEQIRAIGDLDVYSFTLEEILAYPYKMPADTDLVVISAEHAAEAKDIIPVNCPVVRVALRLEARSVFRIASIEPGSKVGMISKSKRFGELLSDACAEYAGDVQIAEAITFSDNVKNYVSDKDVVLLPREYGKFCGAEVSETLRKLASEKKIISCEYKIDEGSMIYIEDKLKSIRESE